MTAPRSPGFDAWLFTKCPESRSELREAFLPLLRATGAMALDHRGIRKSTSDREV